MTHTPHDPSRPAAPSIRPTPPPSLLRRAVAEITRLRRELTACRLRCANLLAAIHAALGAADDGDGDPLTFLRDELPEHSPSRGEGGCR